LQISLAPHSARDPSTVQAFPDDGAGLEEGGFEDEPEEPDDGVPVESRHNPPAHASPARHSALVRQTLVQLPRTQRPPNTGQPASLLHALRVSHWPTVPPH
jgi:hypothetical protein